MDGLAAYRVTARNRFTGVVVDLGVVEAAGPTSASMRAQEEHWRRTRQRFHTSYYDVKAQPAPLLWKRS